MTLKEQIIKLQTYKMYEGEDTVYVERDDVLKLLEQEPCEDCISRQAAIIQLSHNKIEDDDCDVIIQRDIEAIKALPSVTPQPKVGKWLEREVIDNSYKVIEEWQSARCNVCDRYHTTPYMYYFSHYDYCPHCGCRMKGESE